MHCNKSRELLGTADMEKPACSVVAVVVLALVLNAPGSAQAQSCTAGQNILLASYCYDYLRDTLTYPDTTCCYWTGYIYNSEGANCFCDAVRKLIASFPALNENKANALPSDCKLSAGSTCSTTSSSSPPPPPVSPSLPTPSDPGINTSSPGGSSPSSTTYKPSESPNLAAPIGGGVGAISALGIILFLIGKFTTMFSRCCNCHWFIHLGGRNDNGNANANANAGASGGLPQRHSR